MRDPSNGRFICEHDQDFWDRALELYRSGNSLEKVGKIISVHFMTVYVNFKRLGIETRRPPQEKKIPINEAVRLYKSGSSIYDLAKLYGCSGQTVYRKLSLAGNIFRSTARPRQDSGGVRRCSICHQTKPVDQFIWRKERNCSGSRCTPCANAYSSEWQRTNRSSRNKTKHRYYWRNPERERRYMQLAHAQRKAAGSMGLPEWERVLSLWDGACAYCGKPATTIDHFIPVKLGGRTEVTNVVPACKSCNGSKSDCNPYVWMQRRGIDSPPILRKLFSSLVPMEVAA